MLRGPSDVSRPTQTPVDFYRRVALCILDLGKIVIPKTKINLVLHSVASRSGSTTNTPLRPELKGMFNVLSFRGLRATARGALNANSVGRVGLFETFIELDNRNFGSLVKRPEEGQGQTEPQVNSIWEYREPPAAIGRDGYPSFGVVSKLNCFF